MPTWIYRVDLRSVFHNDSMTFEERRNATVRVVRGSSWVKSRPDGDLLFELLDELGETETVDEFDHVWNAVYDEADADRTWIATV